MDEKTQLIQGLVTGEIDCPTPEVSYCVEKLKTIADQGKDMDQRIYELKTQLQALEVDVHAKRVLVEEYKTIISALMEMQK